MESLLHALPFLAAPLAACLVIASLHCYVGLHVIKRGVIFVDLALAQSAALGAAFALLVTPLLGAAQHHAHESPPAVTTEAQLAATLDAEDLQTSAARDGAPVSTAAEDDPDGGAHEHEQQWFGRGMSLAFALLGAVLLALGRLPDERVPHEAIIGIIFVVCAALSVLILSKAPHGHEKMQAMLVGSILFVRWSDVAIMAGLYAALGVAHVLLRRPFMKISSDVSGADRAGMRVRRWDCLFYGLFALMVTQSVSVGGVLVVFSYLIIPAACAVLLTNGWLRQQITAWSVAVVVTLAGLLVSAVGDMPTGASLVSCFGAALIVCVIAQAAFRKRPQGVV